MIGFQSATATPTFYLNHINSKSWLKLLNTRWSLVPNINKAVVRHKTIPQVDEASVLIFALHKITALYQASASFV